MGFGRLKIDKADELFSLFIRTRDNHTCQRCQRQFPLDMDGKRTKGLSCAHFFGRGKESTRFDPDNCDALCYPGCHLYWQNTDRQGYESFKKKQLGDNGFNALMVRANTLAKKDRKIIIIYYKQILKDMGVSI